MQGIFHISLFRRNKKIDYTDELQMHFMKVEFSHMLVLTNTNPRNMINTLRHVSNKGFYFHSHGGMPIG
jgi:hypothetical protein